MSVGVTTDQFNLILTVSNAYKYHSFSFIQQPIRNKTNKIRFLDAYFERETIYFIRKTNQIEVSSSFEEKPPWLKLINSLK
jgi:hypothetical protein